MHANGRRLFRAAVRLHAYAAVRTNLSPYRAVFEAFLRLIYRIRQVPVCTQPPYYPPFALEVPAATAAGIFHFRRAAAPSCRFPVVFPSPSGCFPAAFRLSFRHLLVAFPLPFHRRPACFSCDFRLPFRRLPVASPPLSGCHSATFWSPSRRRPVAAFLNLCRRFRAADIVRPRPFSGNPVFRQNRLPGRPFGFPAECSGQTGFSAGRRPNEKQQSESGLLHTSIALAGDQ